MAVSPELIRQWQVQTARLHDRRAFRQLFDYFYADCYQTASFYAQHQAIAEELVSDVFLKLWERRDTLEDIMHLRAYLLASVRNHCLNYLRKKQPTALSLDDVLPEESPAAEDPEQSLVWTEMQEGLHRAIDALPPRCRQIFYMVREQHRSYREVADALNISPKTVEIQMGIALKRLSRLMITTGERAVTVMLAFVFSNFS